MNPARQAVNRSVTGWLRWISAPGRRHGPLLGRTIGIVLAASGLLLLWGIAARSLGRPFLPSPGQAISALVRLARAGTLGLHGTASARRVLMALILAFPSAAALGMAAGRSARLDVVISPLLYIIHPLPKAAFLPIIILFLGLGEGSKVFLLAIIIFSQILVAARDAARRIQKELLDAVRSLGAGKADLVFLVVLPATLPELLTALRVSLGTAIAVLFLSETFATQTGLGWLILDAWARVAYPDMYAGIIALSGLGLGLFIALDLAESLLCPWRRRQD
jgi:NitT/TauT family transport system permease protein